MGIQGITGGYRGLQGVTGCYKALQGVTALQKTCFLTRTSPDTFSCCIVHKRIKVEEFSNF